MVKQWLSLRPVDTLFFRGSEPMIAGESHEVRSVFPPMPSTLIGSICTAIMKQHNIRPADFVAQEGPKAEILQDYPLLGRPGDPHFELVGPLLIHSAKNEKVDWFFPCPANWFGTVPPIINKGSSGSGHQKSPVMDVSVSELDADTLKALGLCGNVSDPPIILEPETQDLKSLAGYWANLEALKSTGARVKKCFYCSELDSLDSREAMIISPQALFSIESRVGLALENGLRKAKTGHLYGATHVRLKDSVRMAVGLSENLVDSHLDASGILSLGGEQRIASYELLPEAPSIDSSTSDKIMALAPFPYSSLKANDMEDLPRASGALLRMGGWDMKTSFHKPCRAYLPAGTVIWTGINKNTPFGFIRL